ncbi:MAG: UDP-N-acetylmuramoyl-L-alanine--D-glutamate ligase [Actinomycetota bacterium]|nr:UDP-N-acetylmuramoyl-L-alanine--D-glutamate ligase [Actinomycetota bacterium]
MSARQGRGRWAGRRVLVVGLGASGFAAARVLAGLEAKVRVTEGASNAAIEDRARRLRIEGVEVETSGHDYEALDADVAVVSPGIAPHARIMEALAVSGVEIISEVELAYRLADCDFLAITGTNGKTTTTSLLASMLAESGLPSIAAGNIGLPLIDAVFDIQSGGAIAVEVSSFQLAAVHEFRPRVAVLLNVAEDHTDWHGDFDNYVAAKARIAMNQTTDDVFLPNCDDAAAMSIAASISARVAPFSGLSVPDGGIGWEGGRLMWRHRAVVDAGDVTLAGAAGREDVAAAAGAALEYGIGVEAVRRAIKSFKPLRHRLEIVAEAGGVTYIDDSKATNPHATLAAVKGLKDVVLIAGGRAKGIDLGVLKSTVPPVVAVVALGEAAGEVELAFAGLVPVTTVASMHEAVAAARTKAIHGGSVLLSPGCASLDMYESYAQRGEAFAASIRELLTETPRSSADGDE